MEVRVDNYKSSAPCGSVVGSTQQLCNNYCDAQVLVLARCHTVVALISIPIKEQCVSVGLLVCFLSATRHLSTLRRCLRVAERAGAAVAAGPARAGMHAQRSSESTRAHAVQHTAEIFKTLRRCLRVAERAGAAVAGSPARAGKHAQRSSESTRAHAVQHTVVYVTAEIFKKRE